MIILQMLLITLFGSEQYSYTALCIAWLWSVPLVAFGIFSRFGRFDYFMVFLSVRTFDSRTPNLVDADNLVNFFSRCYIQIQHVQFEWLIITYLLGHSFYWGFINATLVGLVLYLTDLGFPGIRPTFTFITIGGG